MSKRRIVLNSRSRSRIKTYLQVVTGQTPDDAMVDRFITSFSLLNRVLDDITVEARGAPCQGVPLPSSPNEIQAVSNQ